MKNEHLLSSLLSFGRVLLLPTIFISCSSEGKSPLSEQEKLAYLSKGQEIVATAFAALSSALAQAIQNNGPVGAIEYCQLEALPITDSLSKAFNVGIKRTSDKWRNPANEPTEWELEVINDYQKQLKNNQPLQPKILEFDNRIVYVAPIQVSPQCLVCHGQPGQDIAPETLEALASRYPKDTAKGYQAGELRGIWSLSFNQ